MAVSKALKVPPVVARTWVHRYAEDPDDTSRKSGRSEKKLRPEHVEFLCHELDKNNKATLAELVVSLTAEFRMTCYVSTVARALDGACYTLKKTHVQPQYMNTEANKLKRVAFLTQLLEYKSHSYRVFYVDETNFNLWTARTQARSPKGERAVHKKVASGGKNMHVTACVCATGLVYYENRFGSNRAPNVNEYLSNMLRAIRDEMCQPLNRVVVVLDNAPCHTDVESVFEEEEFSNASVLRLGPYSPQLNPIESVFSAFKSMVKAYFAREAERVRATPPGMTMTAHRNAYLERASNMFIGEAASEENCKLFELHTLRFYSTVFQMKDMPVGK